MPVAGNHCKYIRNQLAVQRDLTAAAAKGSSFLKRCPGRLGQLAEIDGLAAARELGRVAALHGAAAARLLQVLRWF